MKTKSQLILFVAMIAYSFGANAKEQNLSYKNVIQYFIDSHINADAKKLNAILSEDATYRIPRQNKVAIHKKSDLLAVMKSDAGAKQNCTGNFEIIETTDALILARVDFNYATGVQKNYLTIEKDTANRWKITSVSKVFSDDTAINTARVNTSN